MMQACARQHRRMSVGAVVQLCVLADDCIPCTDMSINMSMVMCQVMCRDVSTDTYVCMCINMHTCLHMHLFTSDNDWVLDFENTAACIYLRMPAHMPEYLCTELHGKASTCVLTPV